MARVAGGASPPVESSPAASEAGTAEVPPRDLASRWRRSSSRGHLVLTLVVMWLLLGWALKVYVTNYEQFRLDPWQVGDWLINYQGGFVRRGLLGQLIYLLTTDVVSVSPSVVVYVLQVTTYVAIGAGLTVLCLRKREWSLPWVLLAPAGVLFVVYNRFVDSPSTMSAYRGELVQFAGGERIDILLMLAIVLLGLAVGRPGRTRAACLAAGVGLYVVTLFSWESAAFFLPVVVVLLGAALADERRATVRGVQVGVSAVTLLALALSVGFSGSEAVASSICTSLSRFGVPRRFCTGGEIYTLAEPARELVRKVQAHWPYYGWYVATLLVCVAPFAANGWLRRHRTFFLVSLAAVLPLFVLGTDYGRWIHLLVFAMTVHWLVVDHSMPTATARSARYVWTRDLCLLAWIGLWSVPYTYWPVRFGGLASMLAHLV